jgi:regulatory protein YycI of two-component signal transduction system YycFG
MSTRKALHTIRYSFDKNEIAQKSTQLAETCGEKSRLVEEKKSVTSDYKAKIDAKDSIISLLSSHITNGYEIKTVECEVEYDHEKGVKRYFYQGVLYDTWTMDDEDRQLEIN